MNDKRPVALSDVYESQDVRDTDPKQPNGLRRVRVRDMFSRDQDQPMVAQVENLSTGRRTLVALKSLLTSKWKLVPNG